jgi:hypothetical protein
MFEALVCAFPSKAGKSPTTTRKAVVSCASGSNISSWLHDTNNIESAKIKDESFIKLNILFLIFVIRFSFNF